MRELVFFLVLAPMEKYCYNLRYIRDLYRVKREERKSVQYRETHHYIYTNLSKRWMYTLLLINLYGASIDCCNTTLQ